MGVPQYTTPTFTLTFDDVDLDLTDAENVYVTFKSRDNLVTKTGEDLDISEKEIEVKLTQAETGKFTPNEAVEIQANWTMTSGDRAASVVVTTLIDEQLLKKVVE